MTVLIPKQYKDAFIQELKEHLDLQKSKDFKVIASRSPSVKFEFSKSDDDDWSAKIINLKSDFIYDQLLKSSNDQRKINKMIQQIVDFESKLEFFDSVNEELADLKCRANVDESKIFDLEKQVREWVKIANADALKSSKIYKAVFDLAKTWPGKRGNQIRAVLAKFTD